MKKIINLNFEGSTDGILRRLLKFSLAIALFFSVSMVSAQSNIDFVGNNTLKNSEQAVPVLKNEYKASNQPGASGSTVSVNTPSISQMFYPKSIEVLASTGGNTKTVLNQVANALVDKGYALGEVTSFMNSLIPKLK